MPRYCTLCGQKFGRGEHLDRHMLTHTGEKPFACSYCGSSFSRKDLLDRHRAGKHRELSAMTQHIGAAAAKRKEIACEQCAKAKVKCDLRDNPRVSKCSTCVGKNRPCTRRIPKKVGKSKPEPGKSKGRSQPSSQSNQFELLAGPQPQRTLPQFEGQYFPMPDSSPEASTSSGRWTPPPPFSYHGGQPSMLYNTGYLCDEFSQLSSPVFALDDSISNQMNMAEDLKYSDSSYAYLDPCTNNRIEYQESKPAEITSFMFNPPIADHQTGRSVQHARVLQTNTWTSPEPSADGNSTPSMGTPTSSQSGAVEPVSPSCSVKMDTREDLLGAHAASFTHTSWSASRCNPSPVRQQSSSPSSSDHLSRFKALLVDQQALLSLQVASDSDNTSCNVDLAGFSTDARQLLASLLEKLLGAADTHESGSFDSSLELSMPSADVLDQFMLAYTHRFELFCPLSWSNLLNPDELVDMSDSRPQNVWLLLLMLAAGSAAVNTKEGRIFARGLLEVSRDPLLECMGRMTLDPMGVRAALLFMNLTAWSGDTDLSCQSSASLFKLVRSLGIPSRTPLHLPVPNNPGKADKALAEWREHEASNRLAYACVVSDQELSLFSDRSPDLAINDLTASLPSNDDLWQDSFEERWMQKFPDNESWHSLISIPRPSLRVLWGYFTDGSLDRSLDILTPHDLRLLLHPLQAAVHELHHTIERLPPDSRTTYAVGRQLHLKVLLDRWHNLHMRTASHIHDSTYRHTAEYVRTSTVVMHANLVMYHLVALNTMTSFPLIEKLARDNASSHEHLSRREYLSSYFAAERFGSQGSQIVYHCGQIIRIFRSMPYQNRPLWWDAAMYRTTLILWAATLQNWTMQQMGSPAVLCSANSYADVLGIDNVLPEDPDVRRFLEGRLIAVLQKEDSDYVIPFDRPLDVLSYCIEVLEDSGACTPFGEVVRGHLNAFKERAGSVGTTSTLPNDVSASEASLHSEQHLDGHPINVSHPVQAAWQSHQVYPNTHHVTSMQDMNSSFDQPQAFSIPPEQHLPMDMAQMHLQEFPVENIAFGMPWPGHIENLHAPGHVQTQHY